MLLKRSPQDNDFNTNNFDDDLNFQEKILIPGETIRSRATLKLLMGTRIETDIPHLNLKAFIQKYC